ncbi:MAG: SapC family protein [Rhodospirillaceae bacterium]
MPPDQQNEALPLFYRNPVPINPERHGGNGLSKTRTYAFAAQSNSVPVNLVEFPHLLRDYPIAFTATSPAMPVAVMGLRQDENLLVDADGNWAPGVYVPAYVRRYPFIFMENPGGDLLTLCVDEAEGVLAADAAEPLLVNGVASESTKAGLEFCSAYQQALRETRAFAEAVEASGILVERRVDVTLPDNQGFALTGFRVIDEAAFAALSDSTILEWRRLGWLTGIHAQLLSSFSWQRLLDAVARRLPVARG